MVVVLVVVVMMAGWLVGGWVGWLVGRVGGEQKNYIYKLPIDRLCGCYWYHYYYYD